MTVMQITGHGRPGRALRARLGQVYGPGKVASLESALDDLVSVDALGGLLTEGINTVTAKDGRLDTKDLAAFLLARLKGHQR